jgi:hypothetical protein
MDAIFEPAKKAQQEREGNKEAAGGAATYAASPISAATQETVS